MSILARHMLLHLGMTDTPVPPKARPGCDDADRRTFSRTPLDVPALLDARSSWQATRCSDLSVEGLRVMTDRPLSDGTVVDVYFELPCHVAVEARAQVVRSTRHEMALAFLGLDADSRTALRAHCRLMHARQAGSRSSASLVASLTTPPEKSGVFRLQHAG